MALGGLGVDVSESLSDQHLGALVHPLEVVRREVEVFTPVEAQPADVVLDCSDELLALLGGVRVVEAEMAPAAELLGDTEVQADGLRMPDVHVSVRLRREPRDDLAAVLPAGEVLADDLPDEIRAGGRPALNGFHSRTR